jgi:hypothetical protein
VKTVVILESFPTDPIIINIIFMKVYKIILAVIVLVIIGLGIRYIKSKLNTENIVEQIQIVKKVDNELQRIMDEENFNKGTILRARKVVNDNNKKIEINRNKKALDLIESEYEAIRQEELLLSGIDGVSLK